MSLLDKIKNKFKEIPKEILVGSAIAGFAIGAVVAIATSKKLPNAVHASFGQCFKQNPFVVVSSSGFEYAVDPVANFDLWQEINLSIMVGELSDNLTGMIA